MKNNLCQPPSSNRKLAHLIELGRRYLNFLLHSNFWATLYDKKARGIMKFVQDKILSYNVSDY